MESNSQSRFARSIKDKLDQLSCPYTENVEESWILELVFTPGESRIRLLQWLFSKLDSKLNDILDPQHAPMDTKMDSRIQRLLFVASTLALCHSDDADLIRGVKTGSKQMKFMNNLLDLVCIVDTAESSSGILSNQDGLQDQLVGTCCLMNSLSSQMSVDSSFPSDIRLLAPDIARQIEIEAQQQRLSSKEEKLSDLNKLNDEINRLTKDLDRQKEILSEILKKNSCCEVGGGAPSKSTLKQTMRLTFSELDQLMTSFAYCYENEMRPWCGGTEVNNAHPAANAVLGPTLKRIDGPLEQFVNLLSDLQKSKTSFRKICSELQRSVSRLRQDVEILASAPMSPGDGQATCLTLTEAVEVLERSNVRIRTSSSTSSRHLSHQPRRPITSGSSISSAVASASIKLR